MNEWAWHLGYYIFGPIKLVVKGTVDDYYYYVLYSEIGTQGDARRFPS